MGLVFLSIDHAGKPSAPDDLGAAGDVDGDGSREAHEREAALTPAIAAAASLELARRGHRMVLRTRGEYSQRHREAGDIARELASAGPAVYVALHLNAGGGRYGSVFHDSRSAEGAELGLAVAEALRAEAPELSDVRTWPAATTGAWIRAYNTIDGVYAGPKHLSAICFEPVFIDDPGPGRVLLTDAGLARLGRALGRGIDAHIRRRAA